MTVTSYFSFRTYNISLSGTNFGFRWRFVKYETLTPSLTPSKTGGVDKEGRSTWKGRGKVDLSWYIDREQVSGIRNHYTVKVRLRVPEGVKGWMTDLLASCPTLVYNFHYLGVTFPLK